MNRSKTILIIEDNLDSLNLYGEILRSVNYQIVETAHGRDALSYLEANDEPPHLIIMDLSFPFMTAEDFVAALKAHPKWKKIPLFVVSGHLETEERALALKSNGHMIKPFDLDYFLLNVTAFFGKS